MKISVPPSSANPHPGIAVPGPSARCPDIIRTRRKRNELLPRRWHRWSGRHSGANRRRGDDVWARGRLRHALCEACKRRPHCDRKKRCVFCKFHIHRFILFLCGVVRSPPEEKIASGVPWMSGVDFQWFVKTRRNEESVTERRLTRAVIKD
jgi:hypothetical protein